MGRKRAKSQQRAGVGQIPSVIDPAIAAERRRRKPLLKGMRRLYKR